MTNTPDTPGQVDALDAALKLITPVIHAGKPKLLAESLEQTKAKLSALLVEARIAELEWAGDHWLDTKTYLKRIKELEKQREEL